MEPSWLQLIIQIPIVGVFIWYTLERDKRERDERLKRDGEWRAFLEMQTRATAAALDDVSEKLQAVALKLSELGGRSAQRKTRVG